MKVSVIVTLYKDIEALKLILDALQNQTYKNFEVIVAEDDNASETICFLKSYFGLQIKHVSHEDVGRTKTTIQNKAVCVADGQYLIFIDGDILPFTTFIESQVILAKPNRVMSGRRVNLSPKMSKKVRERKILVSTLERYFLFFAFGMLLDKNARAEQGIYTNPLGWIYKLFLQKRKRNTNIIGCNWSCYKDDFLAINGFDESYGLACLGDDTDLDWRFKASGCELISSKNIANVFHLYHRVLDSCYDSSQEFLWYEERQKLNKFKCEHGLDQHCKN